MVTNELSRSTSASTRSVKLLGSWDNFDKRYPMEKDTRKGQGEWRGCYSFKDIICDGEDRHSARDGGLKMGHMYYYYVSSLYVLTKSDCANNCLV